MPNASLEKLLSLSSPAARELALHARVLVLKQQPEAIEKIRLSSRRIGYGTGSTMSQLVCAIVPRKDRIQLYFRQGEVLSDPAHLLRGRSRTGRYVELHTKPALEAEAVRALIRNAFALHARTMPAAPAGGTARRSGSLTPANAPEAVAVDDGRVGASKTVTVPVAILYDAWADTRRRRRWLSGTGFTVRKASPAKALRISWSDDSDVDVVFHAKGLEKSQVTVDHHRLAPRDVPRMKEYWLENLARLKEVLES